ncbi:MAG TPA: DUF1801 domain-containing protein [Acidimicrobiales bacterium]|nr:DUF1801 domain-containing protein [Acidimicrobiales bacterium]
MAGSRSDIVIAVRGVIVANLQPDIVESPHYLGMATWVVRPEHSPRTHDRRPMPVLALGERKSYVSLFLPPIYFLPGFGPWLERAWRESGCSYRAGKASLQLRDLDDVPLDVVAEAVTKLRVDELVPAFRAVFPGSSRR